MLELELLEKNLTLVNEIYCNITDTVYIISIRFMKTIPSQLVNMFATSSSGVKYGSESICTKMSGMSSSTAK